MCSGADVLNSVYVVLRLDWEVNRTGEVLRDVLYLVPELVRMVSEVVMTYLLDD